MSKVRSSRHRMHRSMIAPPRRALESCLAIMVVLTASVALSNASPDSGATRFDVLRLRSELVRVDTRTGQIWLTPLDGAGGWVAVGSPASPEEASEDGRFAVKAVAPTRAPRFGEAPPPPELIRMDLEGGGVWTMLAARGSEWDEVDTSQMAGAEPPEARATP